MELRQLRYFIEVAQELHYRRAASRLFISQPALSQQIQLLEEEIGVELFVRSRRTIQRKVELTEAGKILLREAKNVLQVTQHAVEATRRAGREAPIRMGVFKTLLRSRILNILTVLSDQLPQTRVNLVELPSFLSVQQALLEGSVDVGLTILPLQSPKLEAIPFISGNMVVLLPGTHPLASSPSITLHQLQDEYWVEIPPPLNPVFEQIETLCRKAGFERKISQEANSLELVADLVYLGKGVALVPNHFDRPQNMALVTRPLVNRQHTAYPELEINHVVAYWAGSTSSTVKALKTLVQST